MKTELNNLTDDEKKQVAQIQEIAKKLRTYKLKRGYRKLKHSPHRKDMIAKMVIIRELKNRGVKV